jgi:4'-phosphopantetheinyl transferase
MPHAQNNKNFVPHPNKNRHMTIFHRDWLPPPAEFTLAKDEVHIWQAHLNLSEAQCQTLARLLSPDEQQRAQRFYFEQHRQRFIAGRGMLRTILGRYLKLAPHQLQFSYEPRGKPWLADSCGGDWLRFNLSHSEDLALFAVTHDRTIGIDLEQIRPLSDTEQLAKRFFSPREYAAICASPPPQQQVTFFRYWTCKEAYLKATGEGIARLSQIEVTLSPDASPSLHDISGNGQVLKNWTLAELIPADDYRAAVAVAGRDLPIRCWYFVPE